MGSDPRACSMLLQWSSSSYMVPSKVIDPRHPIALHISRRSISEAMLIGNHSDIYANELHCHVNLFKLLGNSLGNFVL